MALDIAVSLTHPGENTSIKLHSEGLVADISLSSSPEEECVSFVSLQKIPVGCSTTFKGEKLK